MVKILPKILVFLLMFILVTSFLEGAYSHGGGSFDIDENFTTANVKSVRATTGWSDDIRLTFSGKIMGSSIAVSGNCVHVVWDNRTSPYEIYYRRSLDNGRNWGSEKMLSLGESGTVCSGPEIAANGSNIHVVYEDDRDSGYIEIYYVNSTDSGETWSIPRRLSDLNNSDSAWPDIAVEGDNIYVVWGDKRLGYYEVYFKNSSNNGKTWSEDRRITFSGSGGDPRIAVNGINIHVVYTDYRYGNWEPFYMRSMDGGNTWEADAPIGKIDGYNSDWTVIAINGSNIHVAWRDYVESTYFEIQYRNSTNNGEDWNKEINITTSDGYDSNGPSIAVYSNNVHILWSDRRDYVPEKGAAIYYKNSTNNGASWSTETRLTFTPLPGSSGAGKIAIASSNVHVVFSDNRTGNWEIYYKRSPGFSPEITYAYPEIQNVTINGTENITFNITAYEPDNQTLTYSWYVNNEAVATNTTNYTFYTDYASAGFYNITVIVSDPTYTTSHSWNLTVRNLNTHPNINDWYPQTNVTITELQNQLFYVNAIDPNNDTLFYQWYLDDSLLVNETNSSYLFVPDENSSGNYTIKVVVSDGNLSASHTWTVTVINVGQLQETINELRNQLNQSIANYTALQAIISQLNDNLSSVWNQLNESLGNNTELKNIVVSLSQNLTIIWNELNQSLSNNTALQSVINQLNDTLNISTAQISALWAQLNQSSLNETALWNQISALNENITNLQTQIAQIEREKEQAESEREQSTREFLVIIGILLAVVVIAWVSAGLVRKKKG